MTFLEAALELLKKHRKPLNYRKLTELAIKHDLLDHVGREPEAAMQTALANAIKKGQPDLLVRVKPGVFGLRHYPPPTVELKEAEHEPVQATPGDGKDQAKAGKRRRSRGGRGRGKKAAAEPAAGGAADIAPTAAEAEPPAGASGASEAAPSVAEPPPAATPEPGPPPLAIEAGAPPIELAPAPALAPPLETEAEAEAEEGEEETVEPAAAAAAPAGSRTAAQSAEGAPDERRRRRRRRRRGRGAGLEGAPGAPGAPGAHGAPYATPARAQAGAQPGGAPAPSGRSLADSAYEILRQQPEGRPVHVRQLTDMAISRRLIRPDGPETWRAVRVALQQEIRDRLAQGLRPRIRFAGGALFAAADRRVDADVLAVERALSGDADAVRRATRGAIARRLARLPGPAYETIARLVLERLEFGGLETIKRTAEALYIAVARPRGAAEVRTLVSIRSGPEQGRRAVGELRAGVSAKGFADGLLIAAGRLLPEAVAEAGTAGPPVELWDGDHLAPLLIKLGIGVVRATMPIEYLDADFFADLQEG